MSEHTPGKLVAVALNMTSKAIDLRREDGLLIAEVRPQEEGIGEANAARLARGWNLHDELVAALERCVDSWGDYLPLQGTNLHSAREQAIALLAKVRG